MRNRRTFLILSFIIPFFGFSQNEFLDFVIDQKNDTIYGTIRNGISERNFLFYERKKDLKRDRIKFRYHKLKKYKKIRFNDDIYNYVKSSDEDGIYANEKPRIIPKDSITKWIGDFINIQKRLPDIIITNSNDTIYGKIKDPTIGKLYILNSLGEKVKIDKEKIKTYRYNNEVFDIKENIRVGLFKKTNAYLKLVLDGKVKLYEYNKRINQPNLDSQITTNTSSVIIHYVEKNNELIYINSLKRLVETFSENQVLVSKILNKEYPINNIYLIVKYYNENN